MHAAPADGAAVRQVRNDPFELLDHLVGDAATALFWIDPHAPYMSRARTIDNTDSAGHADGVVAVEGRSRPHRLQQAI